MIKHIDTLRGQPRREGSWRVLPDAEAAQLRARDAAQQNIVRTSPEAYTRILLDAKEGNLSPGEADRRISKSGGKVRVMPLRRPPE